MATDKHKVRVYTDGRLCITAPILRAYAEAAGLKGLPKTVYVTKKNPKHWVLSWNRRSVSSHAYDLSVRERVLFGRFEPEMAWTAHITKEGLEIQTGSNGVRKKAKKKQPRKKAKKRLTPRRRADYSPKVGSVQAQFDREVVRQVAKVIREDFPDATLSELLAAVGQNFGHITVGDLLRS